MGWYERTIFNRLMDGALDQEPIRAERRALLAPAAGEILEIGLGTGLNLPCYPDSIRRLHAIGPDPAIDPRAVRRADARGLTVDYTAADARSLPFPDARFDTIVSTFVLCSIRDPAAVVRELARLLAPSGRLLVLEHVAAERGAPRLLQRLLDPINRLVNCGCSLTCDTARLLLAAGLEGSLTAHHHPAMPPLFRRLLRGALTSATVAP